MKQKNVVSSRRELLKSFFGGVLVTHRLAWQQPGLEFVGLDHFEFYVSNAERSRDFFVRLFGAELLNRNNKRYLKLGSTYMAFEMPRANATAGQVDHVSLAIKALDMPKLHEVLAERGVMFQDYPSGRDTAVLDPDGIRLQLSPENGWSLLNPATFKPESVAATQDPMVRPLALDHVVFGVTDVDRAVGHYQKILGPPSPRNADVVWFKTGASRVGVTRTSSGQKPGVVYICISAADFDSGKTTLALRETGVTAEATGSPDTMRFRDPDGLQFEIVAAPR